MNGIVSNHETNFENFLNKKVQYRESVPVLCRAETEELSENILLKYDPNALTAQAPVDIERIMETYFHLQLCPQVLIPDGSILGETIFQEGYREIYRVTDCYERELYHVKAGMVLLDTAMYDKMETRTAFTEAHELGHSLLHYRFYCTTENRACRSYQGQRTYFPHYQVKTAIEWTEWQANVFASAILLPRPALRITLQKFLEENKLTWKQLQDFSEYDNRVKYVSFLQSVAATYCVSQETARLRMNKLCNIRF